MNPIILRLRLNTNIKGIEINSKPLLELFSNDMPEVSTAFVFAANLLLEKSSNNGLKDTTEMNNNTADIFLGGLAGALNKYFT